MHLLYRIISFSKHRRLDTITQHLTARLLQQKAPHQLSLPIPLRLPAPLQLTPLICLLPLLFPLQMQALKVKFNLYFWILFPEKFVEFNIHVISGIFKERQSSLTRSFLCAGRNIHDQSSLNGYNVSRNAAFLWLNFFYIYILWKCFIIKAVKTF